jgi:benzodiazapine receptor
MEAKKTLLIGNIVALVAVLTVNAMANILPINGMNTGQISNLYPSLFTPAGFTFSIWSVIYLLLIAFAIGQFKIKEQSYFKELSIWFLLSCFANVSWILVWHYLYTAASVAVMLVLLYSLTRIFMLLSTNQLSKTEWFVIKLPFIFYLSWICVATIANLATLLVSINWSGGFLSPAYWTITLIAVAGLLGLFIAFRFKEPAFLLVLMWAFFGIYSKWAGTENAAISGMARLYIFLLAVAFIKLIIDKRKVIAS